MHQHRASIALAERRQHPIDMARRARAALHGEAVWLVEHHDVLVLEQGHLGDVAGVVRVFFARRPRIRLGDQIERGNADRLALFEPRRGLHALAVDANLALAADLGEMRQRQRGKAPLEPAIEPHARLVLGHERGGNADLLCRLGHERAPARTEEPAGGEKPLKNERMGACNKDAGRRHPPRNAPRYSPRLSVSVCKKAVSASISASERRGFCPGLRS